MRRVLRPGILLTASVMSIATSPKEEPEMTHNPPPPPQSVKAWLGLELDTDVAPGGLEIDNSPMVREVEREVFNRHLGDNPVERVYGLMRTVLIVQDALTPLVAPLGDLASKSFPTVHPSLREYFRDAHDHLVAVVQRVGTLHDLLTGILAANLTRVSIRQNEDMRKISSWVAIAAVPTMIAGVYGMNFEHMPAG